MRRPDIVETQVTYSTPWFDIVAKKTSLDEKPFYSLSTLDYVSVVALTDQEEVLLVKQYRPAIEQMTLELPSGHVDPGETPEFSARKELLEETGFEADVIHCLGVLAPDTGRLSNRLWCYLAFGVTKVTDDVEVGLELFECPRRKLHDLILESQMTHALHLGVLMLANSKLNYSLFENRTLPNSLD